MFETEKLNNANNECLTNFMYMQAVTLEEMFLFFFLAKLN